MSVTLRAVLLSGISLIIAVALALPAAGSGAKTPKSSDSSNDAAVPTGRDALRQIVQTQCIANWLQHRDPAPCERVVLTDPKTGIAGYAVLADHQGGAHFLLIPTPTMAGVDSSELLDPDVPNYFAQAWHARDVITKFVGHEVPRTAIGLAANAVQSRTQNQFHIHIECLRQVVSDALRTSAGKITEVWSPLSVAGATYQALRVMGQDLDGSKPFELLATLKPDTAHHIGDYTLVVAGMQFAGGPGFVVLADTGPGSQLLLDSTCAVAGGGG